MKHFRIVLLGGLLALGGCAEFRTAVSTVTGAIQTKVTQKEAYLAAQSFDVIEITGTNYLRQKRCNGTNGPICHDPDITPRLEAAILSGRSSRNNLKAYLRAHVGGGDSPIAAVEDFNALTAATQTIKALTSAYSAATGR